MKLKHHTIGEKLDVLGFKSYEAYLASPHWKEFRVRYAKDENQRHYCLHCKDVNYILHHITYERLGEELITDVMSLCPKCHDRLHFRIKETHRWPETVAAVMRMLGKPNGSLKQISSERLEQFRLLIGSMSRKELALARRFIKWEVHHRAARASQEQLDREVTKRINQPRRSHERQPAAPLPPRTKQSAEAPRSSHE